MVGSTNQNRSYLFPIVYPIAFVVECIDVWLERERVEEVLIVVSCLFSTPQLGEKNLSAFIVSVYTQWSTCTQEQVEIYISPPLVLYLVIEGEKEAVFKLCKSK